MDRVHLVDDSRVVFCAQKTEDLKQEVGVVLRQTGGEETVSENGGLNVLVADYLTRCSGQNRSDLIVIN
jgi:hypothetical protein